MFVFVVVLCFLFVIFFFYYHYLLCLKGFFHECYDTFVLSECNAAIHKKCIDKVIAKCTGSAVNSRETMVCIIIWLLLKHLSVIHISPALL